MGVSITTDVFGLHLSDPDHDEQIADLAKNHGIVEVHLKIVFGNGAEAEFSDQATPQRIVGDP